MAARTRRFDELRADAYKRADAEGTDATDGRHPTADVKRYINQGRAERYDRMIAARGRSFFRKATPQTITTTASTTRYALETDFYQLISVRVSGEGGYTLDDFSPNDEPYLRDPGTGADKPTHYELQDGYIGLLPAHSAGLSVVVEYVPCITDLSADGDLDYGFNGWEEYPVIYAAMRMAEKDEEWELFRALKGDLDDMRMRIAALAGKRDRFRAERVKDVRGDRRRAFRLPR